ncbi:MULTISPECIES: malonate decarboxylase holo-ACP synthase [unclassified Pseudomonas]|uniref:malonate decarboxylase holo-ACP synthase n=1 Tax=unclassified Pseudomonas TaxID=196821 RepID=UPI0035C03047
MHTPKPHDLLWGMPISALPSDAPQWARAVLASGQPVVVRRATCAPGRVAVGVRGPAREQRLACDMALSCVTRQVSPSGLRCTLSEGLPALRALAYVDALLAATGLAWGPTGGVGYQLATGVAVLHPESDLDLLLHVPEPLDRTRAQALLDQLADAPCRVDVQLETPTGAIALREWASGAPRVLLKTARGPRLVGHPWLAEAYAA